MKQLLLLALLPFVFPTAEPPEDWNSPKPLHGKVKKVTVYSIYRPERNIYQSTHIYWYDTAGRVTQWISYNDNVLSDSSSYVYDERGRLLRMTSKSWKTIYSYDQAGKIIETNRYKRDDNSLMEKVRFGFDVDGVEKEINSFRGTGEVNYQMIVSTDSRRRRQELSSDGQGQFAGLEEFTRDEDGNMLVHSDSSVFFGSTSSRKEEYEYIVADKYQNWLRRNIKITSHGHLLEDKEERVIEYY